MEETSVFYKSFISGKLYCDIGTLQTLTDKEPMNFEIFTPQSGIFGFKGYLCSPGEFVGAMP
jgi:hypothetical protein